MGRSSLLNSSDLRTLIIRLSTFFVVVRLTAALSSAAASNRSSYAAHFLAGHSHLWEVQSERISAGRRAMRGKVHSVEMAYKLKCRQNLSVTSPGVTTLVVHNAYLPPIKISASKLHRLHDGVPTPLSLWTLFLRRRMSTSTMEVACRDLFSR